MTRSAPRIVSPPPLPTNLEGWHRQIQAERTINDLVEDIHRRLVNDTEYVRYFFAVHDSQAKEGSCACDNTMAALMIRHKATELGSEVSSENLATIIKAVGVVLRRYGESRKQRRNRVGGETVDPESNNGSE